MKNLILFGIFLFFGVFQLNAQRSRDLYVHRNTPGLCINPFGRHIIDHNGQIHLLVTNKFCSERCEGKYGHIYRPMPVTHTRLYCAYRGKRDVFYTRFNGEVWCTEYFYKYIYPNITTWENYR